MKHITTILLLLIGLTTIGQEIQIRKSIISRDIEGSKNWLKCGFEQSNDSIFLTIQFVSNYQYNPYGEITFILFSGEVINIEPVEDSEVVFLDRMYRYNQKYLLSEVQIKKLKYNPVNIVMLGNKEIDLIYKNRWSKKAFGYFRKHLKRLDK